MLSGTLTKETKKIINMLKKNSSDIKFDYQVKEGTYERYMFTYNNLPIMYYRELSKEGVCASDRASLNGVPVGTRDQIKQLGKILFSRLRETRESEYLERIADFYK